MGVDGRTAGDAPGMRLARGKSVIGHGIEQRRPPAHRGGRRCRRAARARRRRAGAAAAAIRDARRARRVVSPACQRHGADRESTSLPAARRHPHARGGSSSLPTRLGEAFPDVGIAARDPATRSQPAIIRRRSYCAAARLTRAERLTPRPPGTGRNRHHQAQRVSARTHLVEHGDRTALPPRADLSMRGWRPRQRRAGQHVFGTQDVAVVVEISLHSVPG